jgi:hypothetical protein
MANDLLVIDVKASGSTDQAYPISIGVAGPDAQTWLWLIYPLETWGAWDGTDDASHGITWSQTLEQGRDGFIVCKEMNAVFKGLSLISYSASAKTLIEKLFRELSIGLSFDVVDIDTLIKSGQIRHEEHALAVGMTSRVSSDALLVRERLDSPSARIPEPSIERIKGA